MSQCHFARQTLQRCHIWCYLPILQLRCSSFHCKDSLSQAVHIWEMLVLLYSLTWELPAGWAQLCIHCFIILTCFLSGMPDLWDRTRILRCGDLSHLHVPDCIWVFFYFVWFLFIHHNIHFYFELEQLERLRSEDTPSCLMITYTIESYWIPSQNQFYCEVMAKWPWRYRSRSKALHATHPLMTVIICTIYKKNPSRTVDATERTRFSKSRPNDLEDTGQSQGSSHATHPLMLLIICTKYGKNPSRTVDAIERTRFSRPRPNYLEYIGQVKGHYMQHTLSY